MKTKTFTLSIASLAILSLLVACGSKTQAPTQQSAHQSSTQQESCQMYVVEGPMT